MIPLTEEQKQQLQPGDKLVCIFMKESYTYKLEIGKVYTLKYVDFDKWLHIKETENCYEYDCFALPDPQQQGVTNMRDEVIDLRGSTVTQRRELANLLIDLGEILFSLGTLLSKNYPTYSFSKGDWSGAGADCKPPTITIQSFIKKYTRPISENELQPTTENTSAPIKLTTRVVIGDSREKFEKAVNELETEGYIILPETFLVNNTRYTILMKLTKPKETPCLQL